MNIVVCIKQTPDPEHFSEITIDPVKGTIRREGIPCVINPLDRHALEEGLRLREKFTGRVTAISMGPPQAREVLELAYAMGVDDVILLCDMAFAGADTLATAYPLAGAIKKCGPVDLVICGNMSVDGATGQLGPQLAELLGIPHVTFVNNVEPRSEKSLIIKRELEYGYLKVEVELPALMCVVKSINEYRLPTVIGIMEAMRKEIKTWAACDIETAPEVIGLAGSPTVVTNVYQRKVERKCEMLEGVPEEMATQAVAKLHKLGIL